MPVTMRCDAGEGIDASARCSEDPVGGAPVDPWPAPVPAARAEGGPVGQARHRGRWWASTIVRGLALVWCWTILWLTLWGVAPMAVGWSPNVVVGGSMEPTVRVGSIVQVDRGVDLDRIGPGAIITFSDPGIDGLRVTHRVTGVEQVDGVTTGFRTRGDANAVADSTIVPVDDVDGAARIVVPLAGYPNVWMSGGQWLHLVGFLAVTGLAATVAVDTLAALTGSGRGRTRRGRTSTMVALAALLGLPSSSAAFDATTESASNQFDMTTQWHLDAIDRANPVAHWRLGESPAGTPTLVMSDGFENFSGFTQYGSGTFASTTTQARTGSRSAAKVSGNDPNGAWKPLPTTITGSFELEVWVYRPSSWGGGSVDRFGLEDAGFDGYTVRIDHSGNTIGVERRDGGSPVSIGSTTSFDPPENSWFRVTLSRSGSTLTANVFDGGGSSLASVTGVDSTVTSFDRFVVRGGHVYHLDDLAVWATGVSPTATDRIGTLDGAYVGTPVLGVGGLVVGDPDTAVSLAGAGTGVMLGDSNLVNLSARAERTLELWFTPASTTGRQLLYEEGGSTNGMNVYLDGTTLYATSWSSSAGWSAHLVTTSSVVVGDRYHVAVTLDAVVGRRLDLYVDGVAVSSATKTDSGLWAAHSDDGGIGVLNGTTRFHDGSTGGAALGYTGTIDEVVLYNTVLTAATVANHHDAGR